MKQLLSVCALGLALSRFGVDQANDFLVCVTELNSRKQIDDLVAALESAAGQLRQ